MKSISDELLLNRLRAEENASFELLYAFYFPAIAAFVVQNRGSHADAEDIFQEAVMVLLEKVRQPNFELTSSLKTYLFAIAKYTWLKRLREQPGIMQIESIDETILNRQTELTIDSEEFEHKNEAVLGMWLQRIRVHYI
jgi:RNA polymerase sigma factor (sigma-70 family)